MWSSSSCCKGVIIIAFSSFWLFASSRLACGWLFKSLTISATVSGYEFLVAMLVSMSTSSFTLRSASANSWLTSRSWLRLNSSRVSTDAGKNGTQHIFWKCGGKTGKGYDFLIIVLEKLENQQSWKCTFLF